MFILTAGLLYFGGVPALTSQKSGILKLNLWVSEMMGFNGDVNSGCPSDPPPTPNPTLIRSSGPRAGPGVLVSAGESVKLSALLACFCWTCVATVIRLTWMHLRTSDRLGFTPVCRGGATALATTTAWETASRPRCSWDGPCPPLPHPRDPADPNPPPRGQNRAVTVARDEPVMEVRLCLAAAILCQSA